MGIPPPSLPPLQLTVKLRDTSSTFVQLPVTSQPKLWVASFTGQCVSFKGNVYGCSKASNERCPTAPGEVRCHSDTHWARNALNAPPPNSTFLQFTLLCFLWLFTSYIYILFHLIALWCIFQDTAFKRERDNREGGAWNASSLRSWLETQNLDVP